jgi:hypothetical protein
MAAVRQQHDRSRGDRQERLHDRIETLADHLLADFQVGQALVLLVMAGGVARLVAEHLASSTRYRQGFLGQSAHCRQRLLVSAPPGGRSPTIFVSQKNIGR